MGSLLAPTRDVVQELLVGEVDEVVMLFGTRAFLDRGLDPTLFEIVLVGLFHAPRHQASSPS